MHFSLCDLVADIVQNCAESGASLVELAIWETDEPGNPEKAAAREFRFFAGDNGKGMTGAELDRNMDPFVTDGIKHPGRRVGLGLPFLVQTAVDCGGGWMISSTRKEEETVLRSGGSGMAGTVKEDSWYAGGSAAGTSVEAWFDLTNVDTPPVGDIPGLFRLALLFTGPGEMILKRTRKGGSASGNNGIHSGSAGKADLDYEVKKSELMETLGGNLEDVVSLVLLREYLHSLEGIDTDN